MNISVQQIENDLHVFRDLLNSTGAFYFWRYDRELRLLDTTSPDAALDELFERVSGKKYLSQHMADATTPIIICSPVGLIWFAAMQTNNDGTYFIHVVGPINDAEAILAEREKIIKALDLPVHWKIKLDQLTRTLPMISLISLEPYTQMLHRCVTGENIARWDIRFQKASQSPAVSGAPLQRDRYRTYMLEQAVVSNVRNGNLQYEDDWLRMSRQATGVRAGGQSMLVRGKMSVVTFIGTCTRAAIDGGMTPDAAFTKGDAYLERAMACTTIGDLREINHAMYDDFVRSVHECRTNPQYSPPVQACCDYIEAHLDEDITAEMLAQKTGYHERYLARKFKEETNVSVVNYVKIVKIERAKQLLAYSRLSVEEISISLCFCSRSYFSQEFRKIAGVTPAEYRKQHKQP